MVTVQVFRRSSGKPASGVPVSIVFDGFLRGGTRRESTDSNGEVHFNVDPGRGSVYADGREVHKGPVQGRVVVYI